MNTKAAKLSGYWSESKRHKWWRDCLCCIVYSLFWKIL